jgi:hypothetical protein
LHGALLQRDVLEQLHRPAAAAPSAASIKSPGRDESGSPNPPSLSTGSRIAMPPDDRVQQVVEPEDDYRILPLLGRHTCSTCRCLRTPLRSRIARLRAARMIKPPSHQRGWRRTLHPPARARHKKRSQRAFSAQHDDAAVTEARPLEKATLSTVCHSLDREASSEW